MREVIEPLPRYIAGNAQGKRFLFAGRIVRSARAISPTSSPSTTTTRWGYLRPRFTARGRARSRRPSGSTSATRRPHVSRPSLAAARPRRPRRDRRDRQAPDRTAPGDLCRERDRPHRPLQPSRRGRLVGDPDLHRQLDEAVARAYGWKPGIAHDPLEIKARLAELHASIANGAPYKPFG